MMKPAIVILSYTMIFLLLTLGAYGQEKASELKDNRITINLNKQPLGKVFKHLIDNYDVAIGFEESTFDSEHNDYDFETNLPLAGEQGVTRNNGGFQVSVVTERVYKIEQHWITVNAVNETLEDVLNTIVGQMENYKWEINDDVVNIFPIRGRDKRYEKLLESNIGNFTLEKGGRIALIRTKIVALPEFQKFLDENKVYFSIYRSGALDSLDRKLSIGLNYSNLSFRTLLNKLTKVKRGAWILKKHKSSSSKEREYIEIDL